MIKRQRMIMYLLVLLVVLTLVGCNTQTNEDNVQEIDNEPNEVVKNEEEQQILDFSLDTQKMMAYKQQMIRQEKINQNTYFVNDDDIAIYETIDKNIIVDTLEKSSQVYINRTLQANTMAEIRHSIDSDIIGYIDLDHLAKNKTDLIRRKYDGIDYEFTVETKDYDSNPRVKVKGIYLTENTVSDPNKLDRLIQLTKETEINAFVIDIKNDGENILFQSDAVKKYMPSLVDNTYVKDMKSLVQKLKDHDIYLIGRIVAFKSPQYARAYPERAITYKGTSQVYTNRKGIAWASPYDRQLWEYNVELAKEVADLGFHEIQFDYMRFPSTGASLDERLDFKNALDENKAEVIHKFLRYAYRELSPKEVYVAGDIFGWSASSLSHEGIGQHWEALVTTLDYSCPMIYPSHYGPYNFGLPVPDAAPYKTVYHAMEDAISRNKNVNNPATLRPWIQDFTARWVPGHIAYGPREVKAQIQALEDMGVEEYLLWSPGNNYSWDALQ